MYVYIGVCLRQILAMSDTQIYRYTDIQTYRYTDIQIHRYTEIQIYRNTDIQIYRYTDIHIHTQGKHIHTHTGQAGISHSVAVLCSGTGARGHREDWR